MYSIYKKEISAYFNSLTGYLAVGLFLLVTGLLLWVFPDTSILEYGYPSLESFFSLAPYLFIFLIPAITMRSIAGEKAEGTFELLLSKPITTSELLAAKYLGSLTVVLLALVPTAIYYYSAYQLGLPKGNIDAGAVIGSYIGLILLGAAFTAIGIFTSSLTQNPIIAFLLAVFLSFFAYYVFDALSGLAIFYSQEHIISALGMQSHYEAISRGVLDSRDFIYFLSIILFFLFISQILLASPYQRPSKSLGRIALSLLTLVLLNALASLYFGRIDFTEEKRYTLSPISRQAASNLTDDVHITVFLDGDLPSGFSRLRKSAMEMLADLKAYSGGRIKYAFVDPLDGDMQQQQENTEILIDRGIQPTNLSVRTSSGLTQKLIFPGALITYGNEEIAVNLLQSRMGVSPEQVLNNSAQNLEYVFVSALRKAVSGGRPLVGFTEGHGELDDLQLYDAMHSLAAGYQVGRVNLNEMSYEGLRNLEVLIIAKPSLAFTEAEKYKIDYFVMHGGHVIWSIDQMDAEIDSLRTSGYQLVLPKKLNLDDMLFTYGLRFNYNLIGDMNCAQIPLTVGTVGGQAQIELAAWLFYPIFMPLTSHPLLKNLEGIRSEFAGTLDTIAVAGIKKEIILHSSPFSRLIDAPAAISLQMIEEELDPARFKSQPHPVAALLEGEFPAVFANRPKPEGIEEAVELPEKGKRAKMLAIADGDVFRGQINPTDGSPYPLGWDRYTNQQYGNKSLLLNALDYLTDDEGIISLREKEIKLRLLDQVKIKEEKLFWQLLNVAFPPLVLIVFGLLQQYFRRQRYGKPVG